MTAGGLDRFGGGLDRREVGAVAPQAQIAQAAAGGLDANPPRRTDNHPEGALLQVAEIGCHLFWVAGGAAAGGPRSRNGTTETCVSPCAPGAPNRRNL